MYTYAMPTQSLMDLSNESPSQVYVTAWIDGERGKSAHVSFSSPKSKGLFQLSLPFRQGDPDLLKLQFCVRMRDQATNNKRSMEIYTTCAKMHVMLVGRVDRFRTKNQFSPNVYADIELSISNASDFRNHLDFKFSTEKPMLSLRESALNRLSHGNKLFDRLSEQVILTLKKHSAKPPPGGAPYVEGITSRPFSGRYNVDTDEEEYPPFKTHHAIMGPQQESICRLLPIPVVVYHQYLKIVHSGMTVKAVLELDDAEFGQFFPEGLQFTCDAGLFPYERDFLPELGITFVEGLSVLASDTEDLVSAFSFHNCVFCFHFFCVSRDGLQANLRFAGGTCALCGLSR